MGGVHITYTLDATALLELQKSELIAQANARLRDSLIAKGDPIALPNNFMLLDLERYMPHAARFRGRFKTSDLGAFAHYCKRYAQADAAAVFVHPTDMKAVAVLDIGTVDCPGHGDSCATLFFEKTPEFSAFVYSCVDRVPLLQKAFIEFVEDYRGNLTFTTGPASDSDAIGLGEALSAFRALSVHAVGHAEFKHDTLSESKSVFEQARINASSARATPTDLVFDCVPYAGLPAVSLSARIRYDVLDDKLAVRLSAVRFKDAQLVIARSARHAVEAELARTVPVYVGEFERAKR